MQKTGLIHVYYGMGKGKTTAAVGQLVRLCGRGGRVVYAQFLKDGCSGELQALRCLEGVTLCCGPTARGFFAAMTAEEQQQTAQNCLCRLEEAFAAARQADLLVLDEVLDGVELGILPQDHLLTLLEGRPDGLEVILTGHSLPARLADAAHYITCMENCRHPFQQGVAAREGIEY